MGNFHQGRNRWKRAEAKVWSFVAVLHTKFACVWIVVCLCTGIWRRPDAYALKVAASCFENGIRYSFELLSRRFNATPLFNTEGKPAETEPRFRV